VFRRKLNKKALYLNTYFGREIHVSTGEPISGEKKYVFTGELISDTNKYVLTGDPISEKVSMSFYQVASIRKRRTKSASTYQSKKCILKDVCFSGFYIPRTPFPHIYKHDMYHQSTSLSSPSSSSSSSTPSSSSSISPSSSASASSSSLPWSLSSSS